MPFMPTISSSPDLQQKKLNLKNSYSWSCEDCFEQKKSKPTINMKDTDGKFLRQITNIWHWLSEMTDF